MSRFLRCFLGLILGYLFGAGIGATLVDLFSHNVHDKGLEQAMTAAFVTGPMGALLGLTAGFLIKKRS